MFLILLNYLDMVKVNEQLAAHRSYLDKYYEQHKFICSGPQNPRNGGVILCRAENKTEVQQLIQEDPFHIHQAASYEIIEFNPIKYTPAFKPLL
ncbi:MAG: YciI family protein [Bacteroidota bacterium]|nr:YciI family protein [Bacteroidota bacterium]